MKPDTDIMSYQHPTIDKDETDVLLTTAILPATATTPGRRSSKGMKTKKKKGYSIVRVSTAFGTFAFLLLGVVLFADWGGKINTNIVNSNNLSSGKKKLQYCSSNAEVLECYEGGNCPGYLTNIKRGMCETTGTYNDVLPYLNHQKVIPGKIYYGLDFTDRSYEGVTYTPHYEMMVGLYANNPCIWGHDDTIGQCSHEAIYYDKCPSPRRHIVRAWQQCAELCNDQHYCHTFTVHTNTNYVSDIYSAESPIDYDCFLHMAYECKKENNKSAGIKNYKFQEDVRKAKHDDLGVWSGICRTISGRTNDYACTNTPHP